MKLVIQIPCYNEAANLKEVLDELPTAINGIDQIDVVVIDDGSSDDTAQIAREKGIKHVISHPVNRGLASAFVSGFEKARDLDADIVVNTDGDHQYSGKEIADLIQPILEGKADIVVGDRKPGQLEHFSYLKRQMQKIGSRVVSHLARFDTPDATSGFRAYSKKSYNILSIGTTFSHSLETLIQASVKGLHVVFIPITARHTPRKSRLASSDFHFVMQSIATLIQVMTCYRPLRFYWTIGAIFTLIGTAPIVRFLFFFMTGDGNGHIQSLVLGGVLIVIGILSFLLGVLADQINRNSLLVEQYNANVRSIKKQIAEGTQTPDLISKS